MNSQTDDFDEIFATLTKLRQEAKTRRKFAQELWNAIIRFTQVHSFQKICLLLNINPAHLKRKMCQSQESLPLSFKGISHHMQSPSSHNVVIEFELQLGPRARIQGPLSCLNCLHSLLESNQCYRYLHQLEFLVVTNL